MPMSNKPRVNHRLLPHTTMSMCDKSVIDESHLLIIFKPKVICSLNQNFWMSYSNDHFIYKIMCLLWVANFQGLTAGFTRPPPPPPPLHFHGLSPLETYQPHIPGLSPHIFSILCMQPCDSVGLRPTVPSPPINHQTQC